MERFFRPWACVTANKDGDYLKEKDETSNKYQKIKEEHEKKDDSESVISSSCLAQNCNSEKYFINRRSYAVSSKHIDSDNPNTHRNFVLDSHENHKVDEQTHSIVKNFYCERPDAFKQCENVAASTLSNLPTENASSKYRKFLPKQDSSIKGKTASALSKNHQSRGKVSKIQNCKIYIKKRNTKIFMCEFCNRTYSSNTYLERHVLKLHYDKT